MAATTIEWSSSSQTTKSFCFKSARRHYYVSGKGITDASFEMQLQLCPEWTEE